MPLWESRFFWPKIRTELLYSWPTGGLQPWKPRTTASGSLRTYVWPCPINTFRWRPLTTCVYTRCFPPRTRRPAGTVML